MGFIGTRLLSSEDLALKYDQIVVIDSLSYRVHRNGSFNSGNFDFVVGKLEDSETWENVSDLVSQSGNLDIFHLASDTSTGLSLSKPSNHVMANVLGTSMLLDFCNNKKEKIRRLVLSSSRAVYGEGAWISNGHVVYPGVRLKKDLENSLWNPRFDGEICEFALPMSSIKTHVNPSNIYGVTKLAQEQLIRVWAESNNVEAFILRFQNVYGPGQSLNNAYSGVIAHFISKLQLGKPVEIFENGDIVRDFVYVDDVVNALIVCMADEKIPGGTFDIGTGTATTLICAVEILCRVLNLSEKIYISTVPKFRVGDVRAATADVNDAKQKLGIECTTKFEKGVTDLLEWIRTEDNVIKK